MNLELDGKTVIVTGGARGIGAAIVRALAAEGARAIIIDRERALAETLLKEVNAGASGCMFVEADLVDVAACRSAVVEAERVAGRVHAVVNNAGVNDGVGLATGTPDQFVASLERNLVHYYVIAQCALPSLVAARGAIVNIASKVALTGQGNTSGYAAAKGGILALTREWAVELAPSGVRVNAVVPAEVMTPLYHQWLDTFPDPGAKLADITRRIPLGQRMTTSEEIASAVLFLLSARASHITGQHIHVDGGYVHLDRAMP
ncbi:MAG TPA: SDR family oxidoreductase [Gemmatimonadaceae bacterium]|nr:SDR family oxidoreductase [Gemmatimonadaceae bacterium]